MDTHRADMAFKGLLTKLQTSYVTSDNSGWQAELYLPPAFKLVSCSDYSSTLMVEAMFSSETSVDYTALYPRRYNSTLHNHRRENLKSYETRSCSNQYKK
jgi:hypothetical protein